MNFHALLAAARHLAPKSLAEIRAVVDANVDAGRPAYAGLSYSEIGEHSRASMDDAFAVADNA